MLIFISWSLFVYLFRRSISLFLIYNAKINGAMKEIQNFKQGIFAFKALKDRLPGDINNDGNITPADYVKIVNQIMGYSNITI